MTGAATVGSWLGPSTGDSGAPVKLFCFAHAGGGGGFFQPWRSVLVPDVEVCPVILPGREARVRETPYARIEDVLDPLCEALLPYTDGPYALFGHSMGAVLAYEVARRLSASTGGAPACLFVSGRRAPHLPARREPLHKLPEEDFVEAMTRLNGTPEEVLRQGDLIKLFLPSLRADFELNEVYEQLPGAVLACPVSALTGDADPEVDLDEMAAWRETTEGGFTLRVFRGDHFYLKGAPDEVLAAIRVDIRRLCPTR
jgi:surfactin synthase thioesterase subunit